TCNNNGSVTANIATGAGTYNFVWSTGANTANATTATINSLSTGAYYVTATNTATGCFVIDSSFLFSAPSAPSIFLQNSTPAGCGLADGTATVNTISAIAPYSYAWSN